MIAKSCLAQALTSNLLWLIKCQNNLPGDLEELGDRKTLTTKPPRTDHVWSVESREASFRQSGFLVAERGWSFLGSTALRLVALGLFFISSFPLKARRCAVPKVSWVVVGLFSMTKCCEVSESQRQQGGEGERRHFELERGQVEAAQNLFSLLE